MNVVQRCVDCGTAFSRDEDERWKIRCLSCWIRSGRRGPRSQRREPRPAYQQDPIRREIAGRLRELIHLCHPDKHQNSHTATTITQWLLALRDRLERQ